MVVLLAGSDNICYRIEQENTVDGIIVSFALQTFADFVLLD